MHHSINHRLAIYPRYVTSLDAVVTYDKTRKSRKSFFELAPNITAISRSNTEGSRMREHSLNRSSQSCAVIPSLSN